MESSIIHGPIIPTLDPLFESFMPIRPFDIDLKSNRRVSNPRGTLQAEKPLVEGLRDYITVRELFPTAERHGKTKHSAGALQHRECREDHLYRVYPSCAPWWRRRTRWGWRSASLSRARCSSFKRCDQHYDGTDCEGRK
jgi:hypothetical protein